MQTELRLIILTPVRKVYDQAVRSITAPAAEGLIGIFPRHAPLLSTLISGKLTINDINGSVIKMKVAPGFLEVYKNVITVLTDAAEEYNLN